MPYSSWEKQDFGAQTGLPWAEMGMDMPYGTWDFWVG